MQMSAYMKVQLVVLGVMLAAALIGLPMGTFIGGGLPT